MYIITEYGIPSVEESLDPFRPNRLAAMKGSWRRCKAFDAKYQYVAAAGLEPSFTWIQKLLAHTFYNPSEDYEVSWSSSGNYDLDDIIAEVEIGLETDDDLIQQWFEADDVLKLLRSATNYDEMVDRVRCVCGEFESDSRLQSIVDSVLGKNQA